MKKRITMSLWTMTLLLLLLLSACSAGEGQDAVENTGQTSSIENSKKEESEEAGEEEQTKEESVEQDVKDLVDMVTKVDLESMQETEIPLDQAFENDPDLPESSDGNGDKKLLKEEIKEGKKDNTVSENEKENLSDVLKTNIYGADDRHVIGKKYLTKFPNRAVIYIHANYPNGKGYCGTGYMIGRNTIATAAHCIYSYQDGGYPTEIRLYPGMKGDYKPYGVTYATDIVVPNSYIDLARSSSYGYDSWMQRQDYGIIHVDNNLGDVVGWFGLRTYADITNKNKKYSMVGYYNGKLTTQKGKDMVYSSDNQYLELYFDVMGGQSGSPIFYKNKKDRIVVGHLTSDNRKSNGGLAITSEIMQFYKNYKR